VLLCLLTGISASRPQKQHDLISNIELFKIKNGEINFDANNFLYLSKMNEYEMLGSKYLDSQKDGGFCIGIHPGSKAKEKWWASEKFSGLARSILQKYPKARFLLFGGGAELSLMQEVQHGIGPQAKLAGNLSLSQTAWLIQQCTLFIGNDSALTHIAGVSGVPAVVVFGPSDPERVAPVGHKTIIIRKEYPCSPCSDTVPDILASCRYKLKCMDSFKAEDAASVVVKYLEGILSGNSDMDITGFKALLTVASMRFLQTGALVINLD